MFQIEILFHFRKNAEAAFYLQQRAFSQDVFLSKVMILFFPMFPFDSPETLESIWFSDVFRGIKRKNWEEKSLI